MSAPPLPRRLSRKQHECAPAPGGNLPGRYKNRKNPGRRHANDRRECGNAQDLGTALLSSEGLYNLCFTGSGVVALESYVPLEELDNDVLKVDGSMAVCWSGSLKFSVEKTTKSLLGSLVSGEDLVNVYRGTGKVWASPVAGTKDSAPQTMASGQAAAKEPASSGGLLGALLG